MANTVAMGLLCLLRSVCPNTLGALYKTVHYNAVLKIRQFLLLLLLNMTCPVLANSVDPDQLASEEAN